MGELTLTPYQTSFRKGLDGELSEVFDQIHAAAGECKTVADFVGAMPPDFTEHLQGEKTIPGAFDKMLRSSNWGTAKYNPPAATKPAVKAPAKAIPAKAAAPAAKPTAKVAVKATKDATVSTKRRGNPEALAKARAAKGSKSPEQVAQDIQTVVNATVEYLTANAGVQPVIPLVEALMESLKGQGVGGTDLSESFIYSHITKLGKEEGNPFKAVDIEGTRKRGYQLV